MTGVKRIRCQVRVEISLSYTKEDMEPMLDMQRYISTLQKEMLKNPRISEVDTEITAELHEVISEEIYNIHGDLLEEFPCEPEAIYER